MNILVINAGSSSLKYQLMNPDTGDVTAKGLCERIGLDGRLTHKVPASGKKVEKDIPMPTHKEAIEAVMAILVDPQDGVIKSVDEIDAVGHRVLHGGDKFVESCIIDEACKQAIRDCIPLGPLHNPANLMGIEACEKAMPGKPQVAVFDTAFHMTMPPKAYRYAIPTKYYTEDHLRRYGFHGTSHRFVSKRCIELMGGVENAHRVIVCHLGNGSSLSAVKDGTIVMDCTDAAEPTQETMDVDEVVIAVGRKPNLDLFHAMEATFDKVVMAGDCIAGGSILEATRTGLDNVWFL